jgi:hypothetical protein
MRGHQNMRRYWDEVWETWEGIRMDPTEVLDVGDGRYVVDVRLWGKGKRSGVILRSARPHRNSPHLGHSRTANPLSYSAK